MSIINEKKLVPGSTIINGEKVEFYENSNIIDNQIILCGHTKDANGKPHHYLTKLYYHEVGTNIYEMILKEWCDEHKEGLEDPHINVEKTPQGYYYLSAESKPYLEGTGNLNTETFKSKNLRTGWEWCPDLTIKPDPDYKFQEYSISSNVNYYLGDNKMLQYYECRAFDFWTHSVDQPYHATISYRTFDTRTDKEIKRHNDFIVDWAVCDDVWYKDGYYYLSAHNFDKRLELPNNAWYGFVLRSKNFDKGFEFAYRPTLNGYTIGEVYFTDINKIRFWKNNDEGMFEGYLEQSQIGDNMKPVIKFENNKLSVINVVSGAKYSWQYSKIKDGYTGWLDFGDTYTIPINKQVNGYEFWCYNFNLPENERIDSIRFVYGDNEPAVVVKGCMDLEANNYNPNATEDPDDCCTYDVPNDDIDVAAIKAKTAKIRSLTIEIDDLL